MSRMRWMGLPAAAAVLVAVVLWWPHIRNEFFVILGSRNEPGGWYGFHSGFGGAAYIDLPIVLAAFWWHHQCGVHRCYWYARRTTAAGERACFLHHPHKQRTMQDVHDAHFEAAKARRAGSIRTLVPRWRVTATEALPNLIGQVRHGSEYVLRPV